MRLKSFRRDYLCVLLLAFIHATLLCVGFEIFPIPFPNTFQIALGDCDLALAMLLLACAPTRTGLKLAISGFLVYSAALLHYLALIPLAYPFVFAEEYFLPFGTAAALFGAFLLQRSFQGMLQCNPIDPPEPSNRSTPNHLTISVADLFLWMLLIGVAILQTKRAFSLTDLSGISDPWETIEFATVGDPEYTLARLPLLVAAWLISGVAWVMLARLMLADAPLKWWEPARIFLVCLALSIGHTLVAACYLFFDKPWPLLPVGMFRQCLWAMDFNVYCFEGRQEFADNCRRHVWQIAFAGMLQCLLFCGSLFLVRLAGWRFRSSKL